MITIQKRTTSVAGSGNSLWMTGFLDVVYGLQTIDVIGLASDPSALVRRVEAHRPGVVIIEVDMVAQLRPLLSPDIALPRILVVGANAHAGTRPPFGDAFACGYIAERAPPSAIADSVRIVADCPEPRAGGAACATCVVPRTCRPLKLPLSARENEIFVLLGWGRGPSDIGAELGIRIKTVEAHCESPKRKMSLESTRALRDGGSCGGTAICFLGLKRPPTSGRPA
ncbi:MAG: LuxR C-terminal-related transcriptional regulator [Dokdonella sp.]|uniref:helix-turn-helix transcriptional regulator n=1 Tax=Dokdonella sp. TaxID=2291710 RepID=UPI0032632087